MKAREITENSHYLRGRKQESKKQQGVAETSDYFRRREREEGIISGKRPARKKAPAQTSDYAKRREQEKKAEQGVAEGWPDYDDNQYSLTDSTGKELTLLRGNTPEEAIERAKQLIGSNEKLLATFGLVKLTPRPHYIVRNAKRQGVSEGWGFDQWGHDTWTDAQKEVARNKKNEKQRAQRQQNKDQQNKDQQKSKQQGVAKGS